VRERVFAGSGAVLPPALAGALNALYLPKIKALESCLGRDLSHWYAQVEP